MSSFRSLKCSGYLWIGVNYSYGLNCWWLLVLFQENDCWCCFYSRIMILFNFSWMLSIYHVRWTDNWNIHWGMRTESKVESFCFVWQNLVLDRLGIAVTTKGNLTPGSKTCLLKSELNEIILFWRPIEGLNLVFGNTCLDWTWHTVACVGSSILKFHHLRINLPMCHPTTKLRESKNLPTLDMPLHRSLEYLMDRVLTIELFVESSIWNLGCSSKPQVYEK